MNAMYKFLIYVWGYVQVWLHKGALKGASRASEGCPTGVCKPHIIYIQVFSATKLHITKK